MSTENFVPINLVVLQPTSFCNLDCDYCYLPERHLRNNLDLNLIEPIFQSIFTSPFVGSEFTICWHAGEPLALPVSFYEAAFGLIDEASAKFNTMGTFYNYSFQTNATLINQKWCDFFACHPLHVGVSLDRPAFLHDTHRKTRTGTETHAATMRGISYLQKNNLDFSVIAVITADSLDYPEEIFNFFWENGITDVGFNMEETEGVHLASSLDRLDLLDKYKRFMERFWDLVAQTGGEFKLREFEVICSLIYEDRRLDYTDMNKPFVIVNFDYQGNFSTFDPELLAVKTPQYGNFILGYVLTDSLVSVCQGAKFQQIYADISAGVGMCASSCDYFGVCGGGAGSNKYWENGTFRSILTKACQYRTQIITEIILERLEDLLGLENRLFLK
jgi:uncharacterized protein